jgi:parallel beta-helix repeat protein
MRERNNLLVVLIISFLSALSFTCLAYHAERKNKTWIVSYATSNYSSSIQEAINAAQSGDTVFVGSGTYYENILVNKTVTIIGEGSETTIVDANGTEFAFYITCSNVTLQGFTIGNTNMVSTPLGSGIIVNNVTNCNITRNKLNHNYYGIKTTLCAQTTIEDNNFTDNRIAIFLDSCSNSQVKDNVAYGNLYDGIVLTKTYNCTVRDNRAEWSNYGIRVEQIDNCTIQNNTVKNTIFYAIRAYLSSNCNITNNTASENYGPGISVQHFTNSTISKNTLKDNSNSFGVEILSSTNIRVVENIFDNNFYGLQLKQSNNCEITRNKIEESSEGIRIDLSSESNLTYNVLENNFYGFKLLSSNSCRIRANTIIDSHYRGVWMYNSNTNSIYHNNFINNTLQVYLANSANSWNNTVEGNYWTSYYGIDKNLDGIGDEANMLNEDNIDNHPLMGQFSNFRIDSGPSVYIISNSTISNFEYFSVNSTIKFAVNEIKGTNGFCRINIPHVLINETYYVMVDGAEPDLVNYSLYDDGYSHWVYFVYNNQQHDIIIVSEYSSLLILLLVIMSVLSIVTLSKVKWFNKTRQASTC